MSEYLSRSLTRALLFRINIFLQTATSFVFSHFVFKYSVLHYVVWRAQELRLTYVDTYANGTRRTVHKKKDREMRNKFRKECEK
jgi:hypothetical protein